MDRMIPQDPQIHNACSTYLPLYDQCQYYNNTLSYNSNTASQNYAENVLPKVGSEQNWSIHNGDPSYLQHGNEYIWTAPENTNSSQLYQAQGDTLRSMQLQYLPYNNNIKLFTCEICTVDFKTKQSLTRHQIIHSVDKHLPEPNKEQNWAVGKHNQLTLPEKTTSNIKSIRDKKRFVCEICNKELCSKQKLDSHVRFHKGEKPFSCTVCGRGFTENKNLTEHMRDHTGEKPFTCDLCDEAFSRRNHLNRHRVQVHMGEKQITCEICSAKFMAKSNLRQHLKRVHSERPFKCNICSKAFQTQYTLNRHQRVHTGERPFNCGICNKDFKFRSNYHLHLRIHGIVEKNGIKSKVPIKKAEKIFACNMCDKAFTTKAYLIQHGRRHTGEKPFVCEVCNTRFEARTILNRHMKYHSNKLPYSCEMCCKSFLFKCLLTKHKRKHDDKPQNGCKFCKLSFVSKVSLNNHLRTVHNKMSYVCRLCHKGFSSYSVYLKHQHLHKGKKQNKNSLKCNREKFVCEVCGKVLFSKYGLTLHLRLHTGERSYKCKECKKTFVNLSALNMHMKSHATSILPKKLQETDIQIPSEAVSFIADIQTLNSNNCALTNPTNQINIISINSKVNEYLLKYQNGKVLFMCLACNKELTTKCGLLIHFRIHNGEKPFTCHICGRRFYDKAKMKKHLKYHSEEISSPITLSDDCKKVYSTVTTAFNHISGKKRVFHCFICRKRFATKIFLINHLRNVHKNKKLCLNKRYADFGAQNNVKSKWERLFNKYYFLLINKTSFTCTVCRKAFSSISNLIIHRYSHIIKKVYVTENIIEPYCSEKQLFFCNVCHNSFTFFPHFQNHLIIHDTPRLNTGLESESLICNTCKMSFNCIFSLIKHKNIHYLKKVYVCDICKGLFASKYRLLIHHARHNYKKPFRCDICHKAFVKKALLNVHRKVHAEKKLSMCTICQKSFSCKTILQKHLNLHSGNRLYVCRICNKHLCNYDTYHTHIKNHPLIYFRTAKRYPHSLRNLKNKLSQSLATSEQSMYLNDNCFKQTRCGLRNKTRTKVSNVPTASKNNFKESYVCEICDTEFPSKKNFKVHLHTHTAKKEFVCALCPKSFNDKNACLKHMKSHEKKTFVCKTCNKAFFAEILLLQHIHTHIINPYVCGMCPEIFIDRTDCLTHLKLHSGDKSHKVVDYVCDICQDVFSDKLSLGEHFKTHSMKTLVCGLCNYECSDVKDFHKHRLTH